MGRFFEELLDQKYLLAEFLWKLGSGQANRSKVYNKAIKSRVIFGLKMAFLTLIIGV